MGESRIAANRWHVLSETDWVTWDKYLSEGIPEKSREQKLGVAGGYRDKRKERTEVVLGE